MFPGLDLYYTDPAQHTMTTENDLDDLYDLHDLYDLYDLHGLDDIYDLDGDLSEVPVE